MSENGYNFNESRIVSDIRLVFNDDDLKKVEPSYAVILHNLIIKYTKGHGEPGSFFVAMDMGDLKNLKESLDRAFTKDEEIRKRNPNLKFVDLL